MTNDITWVVQIRAVSRGPVTVGYEEVLPALPARAADLVSVNPHYPPRSGATHYWGAVPVRLAADDTTVRHDGRPWALHDGRPYPPAPEARSAQRAAKRDGRPA